MGVHKSKETNLQNRLTFLTGNTTVRTAYYSSGDIIKEDLMKLNIANGSVVTDVFVFDDMVVA